MRLQLQIISLCLLSLLFTQGCIMSRQREFAVFRTPSEDQQPIYLARAQEFIRCAQTGDVDQMLQMTSPVTHPIPAGTTLRQFYTEQVIPQFRGTDVTWDSHGRPFTDDQYNAGLMFTGTARGQTSFSFDVMVTKENNNLVIMNIRHHHWYNR